MRTFGWILLIISVLLPGVSTGASRAKDIPILPTPKNWQWQTGNLVLSERTIIWTGTTGDQTARFLADWLEKELGFRPVVKRLPAKGLPEAGILLLTRGKNAAVKSLMIRRNWNFTSRMEAEGYILSVAPQRAILLAASAPGLFYAAQSLTMLVRACGDTLPAVMVQDWPDFKLRGITDDISRGQVSTMENFQKIIRFLARYKMNVYMPYIEDVFRFKHFPEIGKNRGALTAQEWEALQDYAAKYHVQIIPIFQTLGHYENILSLPQFRHLAEFPGAASLKIGAPETYQFLRTALDEVTAAFRSRYFHIGADESWDVGRWGTRRLAERYGLASLHAMHYRKVFQMLKARGKTVMMYGDIVLNNPTILNEIPKDVIMFDWHYRPAEHYPSVEVFRKAGQPFIVSPAIWNWNRIFPNLTDAMINIRQFTRDGWENGALGAITSNWGDFGGPDLRELNYFPYAFAADCAWNVHGASAERFNRIFFSTYFGKGTDGLADVYYLLNEITQQMDWPHFFAQPFYPLEGDAANLMRRGTELELYGRKVQVEIRRLAPGVHHHRSELDLLAFCGRQASWFGKLQNFRVRLDQVNRYIIEDSLRQRLAPGLQEKLKALRNELQILRETYRQLWLRTNRPDNLDRLLALFDRVGNYLEIKSREIGRGDFGFNGRLDTPFVTHPRAGKDSGVPLVFLRKTFYLSRRPDEAWLQLIANSHGRIWLNGKEVGEVVARRTLSALVESQRVKAWEVTRYLRQGKNVVAVQVRNYIPGGKAAANVWLQWRQGEQWAPPIATDSYWLCSDREENGWRGISFDDHQWLNAVPVNLHWNISRPYFEFHLPSRIEFY